MAHIKYTKTGCSQLKTYNHTNLTLPKMENFYENGSLFSQIPLLLSSITTNSDAVPLYITSNYKEFQISTLLQS